MTKSRLVLVLHLIGRVGGASFSNQSQSIVKQNQINSAVTFDTQLKTALFHFLLLLIFVYFIHRFWEYNNRRQLVDSGSISDYGLSSNLVNMDAVFTWKKNGRTYIFKGSQYWRYNEKTRTMDKGYPKNIQTGWPDLPNDIDAAVTWLNGRSYIFNGKDYLRLKNYSQSRKVYVDRGYPKETARGWMKCRADTGAIGALGSFP